jgi:hypothetical protein
MSYLVPAPGTAVLYLPLRGHDFVDLLPTVCELMQFRPPNVQMRTRTASAFQRREYAGPLRQKRELQLFVWWARQGAGTEIQWIVRPVHTSAPIPDLHVMEQFRQIVCRVFEATRPPGWTPPSPRPPRPPGPRTLTLGPGESLRGPFQGELFDYSGCAMIGELGAFRSGELPLGHWAFTRGDGPTRLGPALFLPAQRPHTSEPMVNRGVLLCAPPGAGKTMFLLQWAKIANKRGYSTLIVDVKGDMREKLGPLRGKVIYFSTNPAAGRDGTPHSDRINLLAGLNDLPDAGEEQVRQLAEALIPNRAYDGEAAIRYSRRKKWLIALIHLLQIYAIYYPEHSFGGRALDLGDVYIAASDEQRLCQIVDEIRAAEVTHAGRRLPVIGTEAGAEIWIRELALLLPKLIVGGQRQDKDSLQDMTFGLLDELDAFAPTSSLRRRFSDLGEGRLFSLEELAEDKQVTIILEAREQDTRTAETVLSVTIAKLQYLLFNRFPSNPSRGLLLLLDETRRIRSFKPDEYFSYARSAKAGCVVVYQNLKQACDGNDARIDTMLSAVGTQIYLGSLEGAAADYVIKRLGKRTRVIHKPIPGAKPGGPRSYPENQDVEYLSVKELNRLPAGRFPALVLLKEYLTKPILVDTDQNASRGSHHGHDS